MTDAPHPVPAGRRDTREQIGALSATDEHVLRQLDEIKAVVRAEVGGLRSDLSLVRSEVGELHREIGSLVVRLDGLAERQAETRGEHAARLEALAREQREIGERVTAVEAVRAEESRILARAEQALPRVESAVTRKQAGVWATVLTAIATGIGAIVHALTSGAP